MATFVLVHGAWHGAWCWRHVASLLRDRGHDVLAPDLPGHGDDPADLAAQSLENYASRIQDIVRGCRGAVVLVGHSLGGLVISAAAEALPERIRRLVYVTGFLPRDGDSLVRICSVDPGNPLNAASVRTPDGKCVTVDPERLRELFFADCPGEDFALASARLGPEPIAVMFQTVHVTPSRFGRVPRAYIHCSRDVALPLFVQEQMVAASPCQTVLTLPTGHSPFFAAPERLAGMLDSLA
ncbi:MAG: alpha/beta fold hydrolase [Chromatiales bacterium]|nr:alpha/beta fold hydrolase [Chromatiales bacterium]